MKLYLLAICLFTSNAIFAIPIVQTSPDSTAIEKRLADLTILENSLKEGHPDLYNSTPKSKIDAAFKAACASIIIDTSARFFTRTITALVAMINDGHTNINIRSTEFNALYISGHAFPFGIIIYKNGLYIVKDYDSNRVANFLGAKIAKINGKTTESILKQAYLLYPGDKGNMNFKQRNIESNLVFSYLLYLLQGPVASFDLQLEKEQKQFQLKVRALPSASIVSGNGRFPTTQEIINLSYPNPDVAILRIENFANNRIPAGFKNFTSYLKYAMDTIITGKMDMIIDLRNNSGGSDELGKQLFSYFISTPFTYYKELRVNQDKFKFLKYTNIPEGGLPPGYAHKDSVRGSFILNESSNPNLGIQQPAKKQFIGRLVILIDGRSFSTTAEFLTMIKCYYPSAIFMGEESGGRYDGSSGGAVPVLNLPYSNIKVTVPLISYKMDLRCIPSKHIGIQADIELLRTPQEIIAGKDNVLTFAVHYLEK